MDGQAEGLLGAFTQRDVVPVPQAVRIAVDAERVVAGPDHADADTGDPAGGVRAVTGP
ncbi:hypothetical protein [Actinacidiphila yanglinensis]|uniref:hypothetical protein n=1 Tax=Actinacidiphila yanglinensis TaxID=310779 RepID=UPI0013574F48|nr:hypothetical protein [Actinacidiphila yanglinensis]